MGILDMFQKKNPETLDDMSYIADLHHIKGDWHQYDFLLATRGYGWDYMVDSSDYLSKNELLNIGTISVSKGIGEAEVELLNEYKAAGSIKQMSTLALEGSALGIGGISQAIKAPVKIVWFNQTRVIRIFTPINDEDLMLRYAETLIRRSFNTADAMKKAKPVKQQ